MVASWRYESCDGTCSNEVMYVLKAGGLSLSCCHL